MFRSLGDGPWAQAHLSCKPTCELSKSKNTFWSLSAGNADVIANCSANVQVEGGKSVQLLSRSLCLESGKHSNAVRNVQHFAFGRRL